MSYISLAFCWSERKTNMKSQSCFIHCTVYARYPKVTTTVIIATVPQEKNTKDTHSTTTKMSYATDETQYYYNKQIKSKI